MEFMQTMLAIQKATLAARARTGDKCLGTRAEGGKLQVVRVVQKGKRDAYDVLPVSGYLPIADAISAIEAL